MAAAARQGPSDARVPCPLCGGLIHPVAGKCKHCKADLSTYRAVRPPAPSPLPPLGAAPSAANGANGVNGHRGPAAPVVGGPVVPVDPGPVGMMVAAAREASQPVLPPQPARYAAPPEPAAWRSWPILVIGVAVLAIVAAVILMVWPAGRERGEGKHALQPPPAPERMQTAPEIKVPVAPRPLVPPASDPPVQPPDPVPQAAPPQDPSASADPPDDDPAAVDPLGASGSMRPTMLAVLSHMCRKLAQCNSDDEAAKAVCDTVSRARIRPPGGCPAATRCFAHIDSLSCSDQTMGFAQLNMLMQQVQDCIDAARC